MSAREMYQKSVRLGLSLRKSGVRPGDIVSIISQNSTVLTPLSVGLLAIGAIVSYLDENVVTYYSKLSKFIVLHVEMGLQSMCSN